MQDINESILHRQSRIQIMQFRHTNGRSFAHIRMIILIITQMVDKHDSYQQNHQEWIHTLRPFLNGSQM